MATPILHVVTVIAGAASDLGSPGLPTVPAHVTFNVIGTMIRVLFARDAPA